MTNPMISQMLAADHRDRLTVAAARRRLVTLAGCCRPSRIATAVRALRARMTTGRRPAACCA
jgi:hypothetical protein